jgi:1,4-dihydroxy-6-naphthoate synthase
VGGIPTTGWFLLQQLCPEALAVEMPFDQVAEAVARGDIDAGVMIHEELVYYPRLGLHRVVDLGAAWCSQHGLPLPVGLNVIRRDLGRTTMERICSDIRRSLLYALTHTPEALEAVRSTGRGAAGACTERFVALFANLDSLDLRADVRAALPVLFRQAVELGLAVRVPVVDVIEPIRSDSPYLLGSPGG